EEKTSGVFSCIAEIEKRHPTSSLRTAGCSQHELSDALADHHTRRVGLTVDDGGHDRRVGDTQPVHAMHAQLRIHNSTIVPSHAARATWVINGPGRATDKRTDLRGRRLALKRTLSGATEPLVPLRVCDGARESHALNSHVHVAG